MMEWPLLTAHGLYPLCNFSELHNIEVRDAVGRSGVLVGNNSPTF
jgi:hypothetical protein